MQDCVSMHRANHWLAALLREHTTTILETLWSKSKSYTLRTSAVIFLSILEKALDILKQIFFFLFYDCRNYTKPDLKSTTRIK